LDRQDKLQQHTNEHVPFFYGWLRQALKGQWIMRSRSRTNHDNPDDNPRVVIVRIQLSV
jgi:hypothetical protein